ncbi:hypothetical protein MRB53_031796 [Persea americana]|uniref:Uncharacterized protein n=1 Tax=Persea americana TaxID=3435 RepID=A0ACC2KR88_PERAE|nr:hypothetical protein MRB53_031796 [Persea americana]
MGGMLSKKPHDPNQQLPVTTADAARTNETDLTDISFTAGFRSLSLDSVIKITCLPLETNEEAMKMMIESKEHAWKDKNLTQALQKYFTITSNLLLWRTKKEEASTLERYILESQSLEQRLRAYYTKITGRKKMTYFLLQLVASIFAMIPLIGPLYVTLYVANNYVNTKRSILLSSGFLVIGVIGNGGLWFWKRKRNALGVQEELIGPLLMSMVFRNKDLTMQNPDFNALEVRLRSDRNLILQKLGEQKESTSSPEFTIRSDVLAADYSSSDRTSYY